jgi:hypothetical protein
MRAFRDAIADQQPAAGVRVIKPPHALGFLDPDLPSVKLRHRVPIPFGFGETTLGLIG